MTQADVDALFARLMQEIQQSSPLSNRQTNAVALGLELGSLVVGSMVRSADALERIAAILEERSTPPGLLDEREYRGK